jgi:hypothetical protein
LLLLFWHRGECVRSSHLWPHLVFLRLIIFVFIRQAPSPPPTISPTTSAAPSICMGSTPGWVDFNGNGCDWYKVNDDPGCPKHGLIYGGELGVADDNCCYCFGIGVSVFDLVISGLIQYFFVSSYLSSFVRLIPRLQPSVPQRAPRPRYAWGAHQGG